LTLPLIILFFNQALVLILGAAKHHTVLFADDDRPDSDKMHKVMEKLVSSIDDADLYVAPARTGLWVMIRVCE
jgi:hypothetical protein